MLGRVTAFLYGVVCYLVFFATTLYAMGFIGEFCSTEDDRFGAADDVH